MLLRCLLPSALLPLAVVASTACTLIDPTLTLQSYRADTQKECIAMYWQDRHGKAWDSLRSLLAGIDGDGRAQMTMSGGIYDKAYTPLGLYIEDGKRLTPVNRSVGGGNFFIRPGGVSLVANGRVKVVPLPAYKPSPAIRYVVQSGPMLIENGVINWRLKPPAGSRKLRNGVGIDKQGRVVFMLSDRGTNFYDFACCAQSRLGVWQMFYLDGTLSKMYRKGGNVPWQYHLFVTMITVGRKQRAPGRRCCSSR